MTEAEALAGAHQRWGQDVPKDGKLAESYGFVQHIPQQARDPYRVGIWRRQGSNVGWFDVRGEGTTWTAAFDDADRRGGTAARK